MSFTMPKTLHINTITCLLLLSLSMGCDDQGLSELSGNEDLLDTSNSSDAINPDASPDPDPDLGPLYVATAGVGQPRFYPLTNAGPEPYRVLGPLRGRDYGLGEGQLQLLDATPDGRLQLLLFDALDGPDALFALHTDGRDATAPVLVARIDQWMNQHVISPDGQQIAFIDNNTVLRAHLDGRDVAAPIVLARFNGSYYFDKLRWNQAQR